jgi:hypothetical protein
MSTYHYIDIGVSFLVVRRFSVLASTRVLLAASSDVSAVYLLPVGKAWGRRARAVVTSPNFTPAPLVLGLTPTRYPVSSTPLR